MQTIALNPWLQWWKFVRTDHCSGPNYKGVPKPQGSSQGEVCSVFLSTINTIQQTQPQYCLICTVRIWRFLTNNSRLKFRHNLYEDPSLTKTFNNSFIAHPWFLFHKIVFPPSNSCVWGNSTPFSNHQYFYLYNHVPFPHITVQGS